MARMTKVQYERMLRVADVLEKIGMSRSWLSKEVAAKRFPAPYKMGRQVVAWREAEVDEWISNLQSTRAA
ncbi:MAG: phage transcriptional regulator, AlpA [Rhodoferax sp.]|nr:phage transcriptional regulator, AlpA [Rhodoferax sp.]